MDTAAPSGLYLTCSLPVCVLENKTPLPHADGPARRARIVSCTRADDI